MDAAAAGIWAIGITNAATLATIIVRDLLASAREKRRRQYELEDRKVIASKLDIHDAWERDERRVSEANQGHIALALAKNTELTQHAANAAHSAYQEANSVNQKIVSLGIKIADVEKGQAE